MTKSETNSHKYTRMQTFYAIKSKRQKMPELHRNRRCGLYFICSIRKRRQLTFGVDMANSEFKAAIINMFRKNKGKIMIQNIEYIIRYMKTIKQTNKYPRSFQICNNSGSRLVSLKYTDVCMDAWSSFRPFQTSELLGSFLFVCLFCLQIIF